MVAGRFEALAEQHLDIKVRGSSEFMTRCPFCDGDSSLQFNIDKGLWVCFRCDEKGNAKKLVRQLGGIYADPEISADYLRTALDRVQPNYSEDDDEEKVLPESHLNRFLNGGAEYWKGRGFKEETIERWQLGYDHLMDRAIIPYRNLDGELLGVIQRRMGNVFPRYLYPKTFNRNSSLFGSWKFMEGREPAAVLTEGSLDAIKVDQAGYTALAQYGSSIHPSQILLLRRMNVQKLVLFYDFDEAGIKALHRSQHMLDDFMLWTVGWDAEKYCWHEKLCGCGQHDWSTIGKCNHKLLCKCGRRHGLDPGALTTKKVADMIENAHPIGSRS